INLQRVFVQISLIAPRGMVVDKNKIILPTFRISHHRQTEVFIFRVPIFKIQFQFPSIPSSARKPNNGTSQPTFRPTLLLASPFCLSVAQSRTKCPVQSLAKETLI